MKLYKLVIIIPLFLFALFCFWFFYLRNTRENKLIAEGNNIISKVEQYRKVNNRLPSSLLDIGIVVENEANPPIYYEKKDSIHYIVSFGTSLGESKIYFSDSRKWENFYREIK